MTDVQVETAFVPTETIGWQPFPEEYQTGGIEWKLVHLRKSADQWTAMFRGPAGSFIHPHIHSGEAQGFILYGKVQVHAPHYTDGAGYLYEMAGASHPKTVMLEPSEFILTMTGPLLWLTPDGKQIEQTLEDAEQLWNEGVAGALPH